MDFKGDYLTGDEFSDIPAAMEEIVLDNGQSHNSMDTGHNVVGDLQGLNFNQMRNLMPNDHSKGIVYESTTVSGTTPKIFGQSQQNVLPTTSVSTPTSKPQSMSFVNSYSNVQLSDSNSTPGALKACVIPRSMLADQQQLRAVLGTNKKLYCIPRSQLMMNRAPAPGQTQPIVVSSASPGMVRNLVLPNTAATNTQQRFGGTAVVINSLLNPDSTKPLPSFLRKASVMQTVGGARPVTSVPMSGAGQIKQVFSIAGTSPSGGTTLIRTSQPGLISLARGSTSQRSLTGGGEFDDQFSHHGNTSTVPAPSSIGDDDTVDPQGNLSYKTSGLRKYARAVCDKVKEKVVTSYGEVADELVEEYAAEHPMIPQEQMQYIQKNIRRRVYDALNVLMALNILNKERKEIRWRGLPTNLMQDCQEMEQLKQQRLQELARRNREVEELTLQLIALKNLVIRNRLAQKRISQQPDGVVDLPFLVVLTHRRTMIDCTISNDRQEYVFQFDQAFELRDDMDMLKRMGLTLRLGERDCTEEEFNQCLELVPPSLRIYVQALYEQRPAIVPNFERLHFERRQQQQQHRQQQQQQQRRHQRPIETAHHEYVAAHHSMAHHHHGAGGVAGGAGTVGGDHGTPSGLRHAADSRPATSTSVPRYLFDDEIQSLE